MSYHVEIKEAAELKPLVDFLRTLKNVTVTETERKTYAVSDLVDEIKKSEKSKRIPWKEAKKQIASWK